MSLRLFNTMSRKKENFRPLARGVAKVYSCGPTVYNFAHLGNLRSYVFADTLKRVLTYRGYRVKHVMNITDVGHLTAETTDSGEDKLQAGAAREGKSIWEVAAFYTAAFQADVAKLNILPPDRYPRATDHIAEQVAFIKQLFRRGYAYDTPEVVYFDTAQLKDYGKLARLKLHGLKPGARVPFDVKKRNPTDFALWFKAVGAHANHIMRWPSPWGEGFPGWHIECAAMARKYLGQPFDIHTGGVDFIPLHHTNEIAEAEAAYGKPLARYWAHGEFLVLGKPGREQRMGKSLGNFLTLREVEAQGIEPLAFRYLCLTTHYRQKLYFAPQSLAAAAHGLARLRAACARLPRAAPRGVPVAERKFEQLIDDDLNTPAALAFTWSLVKAKRFDPARVRCSVLRFDSVFGLALDRRAAPDVAVSAAVTKLVAAREEARLVRDWAAADRIREAVRDYGYEVEDTAAGPRLRPRKSV